MNPTPCARCGASMDPSRATYDKGGNLVCPACAAQVTIAEGESRASASLVSSAFGILGAAFLSLTCLNPMFVLSILTAAAAVGWLSSIGRLPVYRDRLGSMYPVCVGVVILALVLALAPFPLMVLSGLLRAIR